MGSVSWSVAGSGDACNAVLMLSKRRRSADDHADIKRLRSAIDAMADEWICPITNELPLHPVTAEDGRVYEHTAVQKHILTQGAYLKSPLTNEPMGGRLMKSVQVRNQIEKLVRTGALTGDKAERWAERLAEEEKVNLIRHKAEDGNVAQCTLSGTGTRTA